MFYVAIKRYFGCGCWDTENILRLRKDINDEQIRFSFKYIF